MSPIVLVIVFIIASILGYKVISQVPTLLHTPLMSGSNALSGITILGALTSTALAVEAGGWLGTILGVCACLLYTSILSGPLPAG